MGTILAADIGGTNATIALVDDQSLKTTHVKQYITPQAVSLYDMINEYLDGLGTAKPQTGCFAIAGPVHDNKGRLTHVGTSLDARVIIAKTAMAEALVINDFDAISFAISTLHESDMITVKPGKSVSCQPIAVIGAGTGLGKSLLIWDKHIDKYVPVPSETGHGDIIIHTKEELEFTQYTANQLGIDTPPSWEMALSGSGLVNIYEYLKMHRNYEAIKECKKISPAVISKNRSTNDLCKETFTWFERFYARCAKNAVLDHLATGGVYMAGGIVAKNRDMFTGVFQHEFLNNLQFANLLKGVPVYAIINYDISLIGCANAVTVWNDLMVRRTAK